jgi:hypothetical protein
MPIMIRAAIFCLLLHPVVTAPFGWAGQPGDEVKAVIEEVSLLANFRSEFTRIIQTSSYAALLKSLKLKIQAATQD